MLSSRASPLIEDRKLRGRSKLGQPRRQRHRRILGESIECHTEGALCQLYSR
jgi:hypothetical protein